MVRLRISRYLLKEVFVPTLLGLTVFTFVLLMGRILKLVELVINRGIPPLEVLKLFLYLLPSFFVITIPIAFLLGILLGFGRLSADSEIVALKSCGVSLYGMARPVLLLALLASLATAFLTIYGQPQGAYAFRVQAFQILNSQATIGIQPRIFNDGFDGLVVYAGEVEEQRGIMKEVFISDERVSETPAVILASSGRIISDRERLVMTLRLQDGSIQRRVRDGQEDVYQVVRFATYDINLNLGTQANGSEATGQKKKDKEKTLEELDQALAQATTMEERNALRVEFHQRFALPLAPLLFALVGMPLGIQSSRSGRGGGFALALGISLIYFVLITGAKTLGEGGILSPPLAMWAPNLLFLGCGIALFQMTARERRLAALDRIQDLAERLRRRIFRRS